MKLSLSSTSFESNERKLDALYKNDKWSKPDFTCVAVSPDGKRILTGDENGNIILWYASDLKIVSVKKNAHDDKIIEFLFDSKNSDIFYSFDGETIKAWSIYNGIGFRREIAIDGYSAALSKNNILVVGKSGKFTLYHLNTDLYSETKSIIGSSINIPVIFGGDIKVVAIDTKATKVAAFFQDHGLRIYDISGIETKPDSENNTLWNGEEHLDTTLFGKDEITPSDLKFSNDGNLLTFFDTKNKQMMIYNTKDWSLVNTFNSSDTETFSDVKLHFSSKDDLLLVTGGSQYGYMVSVKDQSITGMYKADEKFVKAIFADSGNVLGLLKNGSLNLWNPSDTQYVSKTDISFETEASAELSFKPMFLPITITINTDGETIIEWSKEVSWVTPLGTFEFASKVSIEAIAAKKDILITDKDLVLEFRNTKRRTSDYYLLKGGKNIKARLFGTTDLETNTEENKITITTDSIKYVKLYYNK